MCRGAEYKIVLGIDAATPARGVALWREGRTVAQTPPAPPADARHPAAPSNTLLQDIDAVLRAARVSLREVELFAVTHGPGSFMGLRAGLATVKAFAVTLCKCAVGVSTLEAIARAGLAETGMREGILAAYTPAGRGELFAQIFASDAATDLRPITSEKHLKPQTLLELGENFGVAWWFGCGENVLFNELLEKKRKAAGAQEFVQHRIDSLAGHVARIARQKESCSGETDWFERAQKLRAVYVRPSDAELKFDKQPQVSGDARQEPTGA
jgi:tRNA threonylcarbamoyladenosine biosynthesis protein TsaB